MRLIILRSINIHDFIALVVCIIWFVLQNGRHDNLLSVGLMVVVMLLFNGRKLIGCLVHLEIVLNTPCFNGGFHLLLKSAYVSRVVLSVLLK